MIREHIPSIRQNLPIHFSTTLKAGNIKAGTGKNACTDFYFAPYQLPIGTENQLRATLEFDLAHAPVTLYFTGAMSGKPNKKGESDSPFFTSDNKNFV
ncbi:hypothetical protein [Undibacterium luofuense]|uniref:Uncharacterized protein n=1 Tax=Undibacterium luofuense TaxID=2828733 RepID=A0A941DKH3_9BURK|nr:hypothetical protein [Undibacterium luofuense]MBR7781620.1 hypothetical protein [Undibacterium luofuense]